MGGLPPFDELPAMTYVDYLWSLYPSEARDLLSAPGWCVAELEWNWRKFQEKARFRATTQLAQATSNRVDNVERSYGNVGRIYKKGLHENVRNEDRIAGLARQQEEHKGQTEPLTAQVVTRRNENTSLKDQRDQLKAQYDRSNNQYEQFQDQQDRLMKQCTRMIDQCRRLYDQYDHSKSQRNQLKDLYNQLEDLFDQWRDQSKPLNDQGYHLQEQRKQLKAMNIRLGDNNDRLEADNGSLKADNDRLKAEHSRLQELLDSATSRMEKAERSRETLFENQLVATMDMRELMANVKLMAKKQDECFDGLAGVRDCLLKEIPEAIKAAMEEGKLDLIDEIRDVSAVLETISTGMDELQDQKSKGDASVDQNLLGSILGVFRARKHPKEEQKK